MINLHHIGTWWVGKNLDGELDDLEEDVKYQHIRNLEGIRNFYLLGDLFLL